LELTLHPAGHPLGGDFAAPGQPRPNQGQRDQHRQQRLQVGQCLAAEERLADDPAQDTGLPDEHDARQQAQSHCQSEVYPRGGGLRAAQQPPVQPHQYSSGSSRPIRLRNTQ
jgi:hypothetical protein